MNRVSTASSTETTVSYIARPIMTSSSAPAAQGATPTPGAETAGQVKKIRRGEEPTAGTATTGLLRVSPAATAALHEVKRVITERGDQSVTERTTVTMSRRHQVHHQIGLQREKQRSPGLVPRSPHHRASLRQTMYQGRITSPVKRDRQSAPSPLPYTAEP